MRKLYQLRVTCQPKTLSQVANVAAQAVVKEVKSGAVCPLALQMSSHNLITFYFF